MDVLRGHFRPEFLNRLDDIVMFDPLSEADLTRIVDINLERLNARMAERCISVEVTPAGKQWLARTGFDPVYGARPLRRLIQTSVENPLARSVLSGEVTEGSTVSFDVDEDADKLVIV